VHRLGASLVAFFFRSFVAEAPSGKSISSEKVVLSFLDYVLSVGKPIFRVTPL